MSLSDHVNSNQIYYHHARAGNVARLIGDKLFMVFAASSFDARMYGRLAGRAINGVTRHNSSSGEI